MISPRSARYIGQKWLLAAAACIFLKRLLCVVFRKVQPNVLIGPLLAISWRLLGPCGGASRHPNGPKNNPKVVATLRPDSSRVWPLPTGCRRSSGARITIETRAVHVRCERGAFILPRKTQHFISCWVIPCAKSPAACVFWDVFRAAVSPQKTFTKGRGQILVVFSTCRGPA